MRAASGARLFARIKEYLENPGKGPRVAFVRPFGSHSLCRPGADPPRSKVQSRYVGVHRAPNGVMETSRRSYGSVVIAPTPLLPERYRTYTSNQLLRPLTHFSFAFGSGMELDYALSLTDKIQPWRLGMRILKGTMLLGAIATLAFAQSSGNFWLEPTRQMSHRQCRRELGWRHWRHRAGDHHQDAQFQPDSADDSTFPG